MDWKPKVLVVEISGKRPGNENARPTEKMQIDFDHLIISNNSEGYITQWDIVNVPSDYVEWYKASVKTSESAWYAPMNRSYAIKYAKDHGYDYLFQLDDNITGLELSYEIQEGEVLKKYRHSGIEMVNDFISFMVCVMRETNAAMVGMRLQGSARPKKDFIGERYCYSFFALNVHNCPALFHGDFEDDIEYRLKCKEMALPTLQIYPMAYGKTGQKSNKDETGNRAAYTAAGLKRGEHMLKLHGDVYSCGFAGKTMSMSLRGDVGEKCFKHKIKPFKVGTLIKNNGIISAEFNAMLKKYAERHEDRCVVKEIKTKSRKGNHAKESR